MDAALVGPTDLSIALEVPGRMRDPILGAAIERVRQTCDRVGLHPAIHTNDVALTAEWAQRGMHLVSINSEVGLLLRAAKEAVETIRGAVGGPAAG